MGNSDFNFGHNKKPQLFETCNEFCPHGIPIDESCNFCADSGRVAEAKKEVKHDEHGTKEQPAAAFVISFVEEQIKNLTRKVHEMCPISASAIAPQKAQPQQQKQLIHGSDCVVNGKLLREITLRVTGIRQSPPGFNAPLLMDFEKQFEKESLALNKTNIRALGTLCEENFGNDDLEKLIGCDIVFQIVSDNNPSTGKPTPTLRVAQNGLILSRSNKISNKTKK